MDKTLLFPDNPYSLISIEPILVKHNIIFNIKIPLLTNSKFQIFKNTVVPTLEKDMLMYLDNISHYIMASLDRKMFQLLNKDQFNSCIDYKNDEKVCNRPRILYNDQQKECEWLLLNNMEIHNECTFTQKPLKDVWIELEQDNKWIIVIHPEKQVTTICSNTNIQQLMLGGEGIVTINATCKIVTKTHMISGQEIVNDSIEVIIPKASIEYNKPF